MFNNIKNLWKALFAPKKQEAALRAEIKSLRARLEIAEDLLLRIEAKKPDLSYEERTRIRQAKCKHTKGGRRWPHNSIIKDYAVRDFTFVDGVREIACLICGKKWRPGYQGWDNALEMLESSTNTSSSSERLFEINPNAKVKISTPHSKIEEAIKEANKPRNLYEENPIRGLKINRQ